MEVRGRVKNAEFRPSSSGSQFLGVVKMTKTGDQARCPQCRGTARVIWISQDEKTMAIKCTRYHSQISPPPTKFSSRAQSKTKKGMVFLVEMDAQTR